MNFNIVDGTPINYEEVKQAYLNGVRGENLREMFNLGSSSYKRLLKSFREEGITVQGKDTARNYYKQTIHGQDYYTVYKTVKGKKIYFGHFKTEKEAKDHVEYLKKNNWGGLI